MSDQLVKNRKPTMQILQELDPDILNQKKINDILEITAGILLVNDKGKFLDWWKMPVEKIFKEFENNDITEEHIKEKAKTLNLFDFHQGNIPDAYSIAQKLKFVGSKEHNLVLLALGNIQQSDTDKLKENIANVYRKTSEQQKNLLESKPKNWKDDFIELRRAAINEVADNMAGWLKDSPGLLYCHEKSPLDDRAGGIRSVLLFKDEENQVFSYAFIIGPKQSTSAHDHKSLFCCSTGIQGGYTETSIGLDKKGNMFPESVKAHQAESHTTVGKHSEIDRHIITNPAPEGYENTIRIHVYDGYRLNKEKDGFVSLIEESKNLGINPTSVENRWLIPGGIDPATLEFPNSKNKLMKLPDSANLTGIKKHFTPH